MKKAVRELLARRPYAHPVTRIEHTPAAQQIWTNSLTRARWFADNTPDTLIVQGWIVHPYIKASDTEGQTILEPYYWNYDQKKNTHVNYGPEMLENRSWVEDRWALLNTEGTIHYPFPPILHLLQLSEGLLWCHRTAAGDLITMPDIDDQELAAAVIAGDANPETAGSTGLVSASGTSLGSTNIII